MYLVGIWVLEMADEEELEEEGEEDEDLEGEYGEDDDKPGSSKKVLIIVGVVLLLAVGGFAAAYFTGLIDPVIAWITGAEEKEQEEGQERVRSVDAVFFPLEEVIVNLNTGGRKSSFLKIRISLELENSGDIKRVETVMPRIMDNFQAYLRELRIEDFKECCGDVQVTRRTTVTGQYRCRTR